MKFCTQCGAQVEDANKFCTACGAAMPEAAVAPDAYAAQAPVYAPQPAAAPSFFKTTLGKIVMIGVPVIIVAVVLFLLLGGGGGVSHSSAKAVVESSMDAMTDLDFATVLESMPEEMSKEIRDSMGGVDLKAVNDMMKSVLKSQFGDNFKIDYKILSVKDMTDEEMQEYIEYDLDDYDFAKDIDAMALATIELNMTAGDDTDSQEQELHVARVDGKWYVVDSAMF